MRNTDKHQDGDYLTVTYDGQTSVVDPNRAKRGVPKIKLDAIETKPRETAIHKAATKSRETLAALRPGHEKFDLYCNALPAPIRELIIKDETLCARSIYKEYRTLKKEGLLAKYIAA